MKNFMIDGDGVGITVGRFEETSIYAATEKGYVSLRIDFDGDDRVLLAPSDARLLADALRAWADEVEGWPIKMLRRFVTG